MSRPWPAATSLSPYHECPAAWRRRSVLELGALPTAAGAARGHAACVLREWGLPGLVDATELVVSELVSNAVAAVAGMSCPVRPPVRLWLLSDGPSVLVKVWDAVPAMPVPALVPAGADDESGRGLAIVAALSVAWSCYPSGAGKVAWAHITTALEEAS